MSKKTVALLCGLAILIVALSFLWGTGVINVTDPKVSPAGPQLRVDGCHRTFMGKGRPGELLSSSVILQNVGTEPLHFWATGSLPVTSLEPREATIEPRGMVELKVTLRLREQGRDEHAVVHVHTNDPATPIYQHRFLALCPAPLEVSPGVVAFGNVQAGSSPTCTLRLKDPDGMPLSPSRIKVVSSSPHLTFEPKALSDREVLLVVRLSDATPRGEIRGDIRLGIARAEGEVVIPVSACVKGPVRTAPEIVFLIKDASAKEQRGAALFVWRADAQPLGPVEAITKPDWLSVKEGDSKDPKLRRFHLRAERDPGSGGPATVRIRFADAPEEALVTVEAEGDSQLSGP